jgi:hypothetical protein
MRIEVIDDATAEIYRRMTPVERVRRGLHMGQFARNVIRANVLSKQPLLKAEQTSREVARRFAGD